MTITGAAARKIGRLSALRPDADVRIEEIEHEDQDEDQALAVHFLDEYALDVVARFVVREDGWSNPSLARAKREAGL